jgi:hypothetical protein
LMGFKGGVRDESGHMIMAKPARATWPPSVAFWYCWSDSKSESPATWQSVGPTGPTDSKALLVRHGWTSWQAQWPHARRSFSVPKTRATYWLTRTFYIRVAREVRVPCSVLGARYIFTSITMLWGQTADKVASLTVVITNLGF